MQDSVEFAENVTGRALARRAFVLFFNFFLIILAYYQVKSASRSLLLEAGGAEIFPYVWIVSAVTLGAFISYYHRVVEQHSRLRVVLGCLLVFVGLLVVFRVLLPGGSLAAALGFYVFVDILSVILVEQFWSLTNSISASAEGRKSYWFIGSGGLVGGILGGKLTAVLIDHTAVQTPDLLLVCAGFLGLVFLVNLGMARMGLYAEIPQRESSPVPAGDWRVLIRSRYLLLIAAALFSAQMAQPVVEYQFIAKLGEAYPDREARTAHLGEFFFVLGLVAVAVNLVLTPLIHRYLGVLGGLLAQPVTLAASSLVFMAQPVLFVAEAMKIADRGLSYSINRASKELLYIPVDPVHTYQAKAWIDMLGYRLFKVAGSGLIILFTYFGLSAPQLGWLTLVICAGWAIVVLMLARAYRAAVPLTAPAE